MKIILKIIAIFIFIIAFQRANAQQTGTDSLKNYLLPAVSIFGDKTGILNSIPGSAVIISTDQLKILKGISGNQVLQAMTGINVVEEEGAGLRMNLGIRGLDPDRSRTLLVLEDGIPVALAPYGEPEMYYTPSIDRMNSIEILKGSGSIIYGPQTIGGVLNYITNDPPVEPRTDVHFAGGGSGFLNSKIGYGASSGPAGFLAEMYHKRADNLGLTNYQIYDFMAKGKFAINGQKNLSLKIGVYDEKSNSTYVGLTQTMYDAGEYFQEIAPNDELKIRRYSASLNYQHTLSKSSVLNLTLFGYNTSRLWRRQEFSRNASASNKTGVVFGDTAVSGGAIYMRNLTGNRDRTFDVFGVQPQINASVNFAGLTNEINLGARFLYERAFEQRINGTSYNAVSGNLVEDEIRTGLAFSAFIQDRIFAMENLIITPGLRFEHFDYERDIYRIQSKDTSIVANKGIAELIPGIGINYNISERFTLFSGLHRGFAPPRTKDAITNEGVTLDLEAELSWNYELGLRSNLGNSVSFEVTGYMLDFSNQVIPVSESSGGAGFGLVNGGSTLHKGIETSVTADLGRLLSVDYSLILNINGTYSDSKYNSDRFVTSGDNKVNIKGNRLQYAPEFLLSSTLQFKSHFGLGANIKTVYVGEQFTDDLNTVKPSADGTIGLMDSYFLIDFTLLYELNKDSDIYVTVKNLTDERYIASRRPQGIKVGIPRFISGGIDYHF